ETVQRVLVDGRPYFGDDPTVALRNLPAEVIDRIQVFDQMSDQAQFTGFDDGQSVKTINVITRRRRGDLNFGKVTGGYGENGRYDAAGNMNLFDGNRRISVLGSSNNINQQDFSTQDILGVISTNNRVFTPGAGPGFGGGGPRRANPFGRSGGVSPNSQLVGQQQGINTTSVFGANASDSLANDLFAQASYFFNQVNNQNIQADHRLYLLGGDSTSLYDQNSNVASRNFNNRINARIDYAADPSNSLTFLPVLYFQSNRANNLLDAVTTQGTAASQSLSNTNSLNDGYNLTGHIIYRHRFDLPGRTVSLDVGVGSNRKNTNGYLSGSNDYSGATTAPVDSIAQQTGNISNAETVSANLIYTEPTDVNAMMEFFYNPSFTRNTSDKTTYDFDPATGEYTSLDLPLSNVYADNYVTQRAGVGYRWRGSGFNIMANISYQYAELQGDDSTTSNMSITRRFGSFLPSAMLMYRTPDHRMLRIFYRTYTVAPAVTQLQQVVDNTNPLLLTTGNPQLAQSFTHSLMARYNLTTPGRAESMFLFATATYTRNYIANATIIPARDTVLSNGTAVQQGAQLTYPVNLNGYWNAHSFFTYGFPFDLISSAVNLSSGAGFTRTPGILNEIRSVSNTVGPSAGFVIGSNISQDFDFTVSYMGNYNFAGNTLQSSGNNNYYSHTASLRWVWEFWNGIVLNNLVSNALTSGLAQGYNQNIILWNIAVGKKFFANERGELQLSVNDLLGQNKSVNRTVTDTYVDDTSNEVLTRYVMLTFSYTVR
ncbi:MAG TPA: outer membrane beta-barrel protein, partial [Candidatus Kryptobacter bacterium]|nr:outer membrane beta-barrel protein [Candidatus Kryptobacter bacterium]